MSAQTQARQKLLEVRIREARLRAQRRSDKHPPGPSKLNRKKHPPGPGNQVSASAANQPD
jgi:hypothetical protein